jgi:electron transfer flavoprotein alpha subunit
MILGFVEHDRGTLNPLSLQMLTLGRRLSEQLSEPLHALVVGEGGRALAETAAVHGASTVHLARGYGLDDYVPGAWAQCAVRLIQALRPSVVLAAGTDRGQEVMAHIAARTGAVFAANCIDVRPVATGREGTAALPYQTGLPVSSSDPSVSSSSLDSAERFEVTRQRWGGSLLEDATVAGDLKLLTVAAHAFPALDESGAQPAGDASSRVEVFEPELREEDFAVRISGRVEPDRNRISLADAKAVVGGGRGVGSAEGFQVLQEIADLLGGTVGCSRAVTSLGWRPHSDQVGQTGTRIAPDVYIACGISGAIQHMVGCKSAKCVVAINKDPDAPIMSLADYAIVGDVQEILPALRDAIRNRQASS